MDVANSLWMQLTLLLTVSVGAHYLINRMKQPLIVGEILVGIVIGFIGLNLLGDESLIGVNIFGAGIITNDVIAPFAELGSIILLFMIGLECDIKQIYTKRNMVIALGGVVLPWIVGFLVFGFMVPTADLKESIFVGTILVATSVAVTASVLQEMGAISTPVGTAILGAAVVDDVLGMIVLAISKGAIGGSVDVVNVLYLIAAAAAFIVLGIFIGTRFICKAIDKAECKYKDAGMRHTGFILALAVAFAYAYIAELIGISAIVGAFVAGTIFASISCRHEFEDGTRYLAAVFVPVFFVSAGIMFNVDGLAGIFLVVIVITILAIVTKLIGCGVPARLLGMSNKEAFAVGIGMAPRLEVAIVIAIYGLDAGIIGQDVYSMAIFVGLVTALLTPSLFKWSLQRLNHKEDNNEPAEKTAEKGFTQ